MILKHDTFQGNLANGPTYVMALFHSQPQSTLNFAFSNGLYLYKWLIKNI